MKQYLLLLLFVICTGNTIAQITSDEEVNQLKNEISALKQQVGNQKSITMSQQKKINSLQSELGKSKMVIDSLQANFSSLSSSLTSTEERLGTDISKTNQVVEDKTTSLKDSINSKSIIGIIIMLALAILAGFGIFQLRKKVYSSDAAIDAVKDAQKKLEEESIKLDNQLVEIINNQLNAQSVKTQSSAPDHSLVLKVADEIVRIELNLSRMDPSIKGYKQLTKGVERIKDNFKAKGYEITDMLGKPYVEGMKVVANFTPDDTLPEGSQIITGIIKPQIIYNGTMIQAAEITVSQNI